MNYKEDGKWGVDVEYRILFRFSKNGIWTLFISKGTSKEKEVKYLRKKMEEPMNQGHMAGKRRWEAATEAFVFDIVYEKRQSWLWWFHLDDNGDDTRMLKKFLSYDSQFGMGRGGSGERGCLMLVYRSSTLQCSDYIYIVAKLVMVLRLYRYSYAYMISYVNKTL